MYTKNSYYYINIQGWPFRMKHMLRGWLIWHVKARAKRLTEWVSTCMQHMSKYIKWHCNYSSPLDLLTNTISYSCCGLFIHMKKLYPVMIGIWNLKCFFFLYILECRNYCFNSIDTLVCLLRSLLGLYRRKVSIEIRSY